MTVDLFLGGYATVTVDPTNYLAVPNEGVFRLKNPLD
jgi:hypothetical protein